MDFQLRQGDKILNNSQYFQITGLSKLQALGDCYDGDTMVNQPGNLRRGSTVSILSQAGGRRSSVISLVSNSGENVVKMTVRTNRTRRLSSVATQLSLLVSTLLGLGERKVGEMKIHRVAFIPICKCLTRECKILQINNKNDTAMQGISTLCAHRDHQDLNQQRKK